MALELQIISPKPEQRFPEIKWNNAELKKEIAEAVKDYQNLVVTAETEKDCKETRAKLNKLRTAIEDARKDMKKRVNEPFKVFEAQVKEVEEPIDTAIANLDEQLKELVEARKNQKRKDIETIFNGLSKPNYLTLDRVWDERWLNATYAMRQIVEDLNAIVKKTLDDIDTLGKLPEYAFEALQFYSQTLDVNESIRRAQEHAEMERQKRAIKAEPKTMPTTPQNGVQEEKKQEPNAVKEPVVNVVTEKSEDEKVYTFSFRVTVTAKQAQALGDFCRANGINLVQIQ